jgi:uncharacterized membrane protein
MVWITQSMLWLYLLWPLAIVWIFVKITRITKNELALRFALFSAFAPVALLALLPFCVFGIAVLGDVTGWFRIDDFITKN